VSHAAQFDHDEPNEWSSGLHRVDTIINSEEGCRFAKGSGLLLTIYERVLRERFGSLNPPLRHFLADARGGRAVGLLRVTRAMGRVRNAIASGLGIPPAGEYETELDVSPLADGQRWKRRFGDYALETTQREYRGLLVEASGPASIGFELVVDQGSLLFVPRRAWVFGIPLPRWLAPRIEAENSPAESGGWRVRVRFGVPLLGQVAEYEGNVIEEAAADAAPASAPGTA
jgi:hypothetical protein